MVSWDAIHEAAFIELKGELESAVILAYPKDKHIVSIFSDTSNKFWAGVITQYPQIEADKNMEKKYEVSAFLGGKFSPTQESCSRYEMEPFDIVKMLDRMEHLCGINSSESIHGS